MNRIVFLNRNVLSVLLVTFFVLAGCGATLLQIKAGNALQANRYDEAVEICQEILKTDPANVEALKVMGEANLRMKKFPEAVAALEKAYAKDPDRQTIINLGLAYSGAGDYGKAISTWDVLLARERDSNITNLVKKHRTLALYKDASLQAKNALAQERALISEGPAKARAKAPSKERLGRTFPVDANTLAVSPFADRGKTEKTKHLRKALAAMIITDLSKAPDIRVVERVRMQKLLDELKLGQSGIIDPATSPRVGRLLGAGKIVSGSMLGTSDDNLHILRILTNVSTGKDLGDQDAQGKVDEFFKLQKAIVFGIFKDLGIKLTPLDEDLISRYATRNYKGLLLYGEGLDWQDMGEWDKAIQVFQQCVIIDPMGPCGPALAAAPSGSDATTGPEGVVAAVTAAAAAEAAAAEAAAAASAGGGGGGGGH